jgi:hypothetical protein
MIGGMILARGVQDPHTADRILADVRDFLRDAPSTDTPAQKRRTRRKAREIGTH